MYDALTCGRIDTDAWAGLLSQAWRVVDEGPVKLAVDVSPWARPDAVTSAGLCHCYAACRCDRTRKTIPGWPYSFVAGPEWGASSWTAPLDVVRLGVNDDATAVTVAQVAGVVARLAVAGVLVDRPAPVVAFDAGYDLTRISYLAGRGGLSIQVLGRVRRDRVFYAAPAYAGRVDGRPGRPRRHGERFALAKPEMLPAAEQQVTATSRRYGQVRVSAWHGLHQKLERSGGWVDHTGDLPIVAGTIIRIQVDHLPGNRACNDPVPTGPLSRREEQAQKATKHQT